MINSYIQVLVKGKMKLDKIKTNERIVLFFLVYETLSNHASCMQNLEKAWKKKLKKKHKKV